MQDSEDDYFIAKIQAQKVEIETLQKQLRQQDFIQKQQILELSSELEGERKRVQELEAQIYDFINNDGLKQFALSLEEKLAQAENSILEYQNQEVFHQYQFQMHMQREIQALKRKSDNEEIEDLKQQILHMEEMAIQLIVEKDTVINELKDQLVNQNLEVQQNDYKEKDQQIINLTQVIQELNFKLEQEQLLMDEKIIKTEYEVTQRVLDNLNQAIDQSKYVERDLLQQIGYQEERIKQLDRLLKDQEKLIQNLKEEHYRENQTHENRSQELQRKLSNALQQVLKSDKKCEEAFQKYQHLQREKQNINKQKEELQKQIQKQEKVIKKLQSDLGELQQLLEQQQNQTDELENNLQEELQKYDNMVKYYEQELQSRSMSLGQEIQMRRDMTEENEQAQGQGGNLLSELLQTPNNNRISLSPKEYNHQSNQQNQFSNQQSARRSTRRNDENELHKEEIRQLKLTIENLEIDNDNFQLNIEVLQREIKKLLLEVQSMRRQKLENGSDKDLRQETETLKQHLHKVETMYLTSKLTSAEEIDYLKSELRRSEKISLDSQLLFNQITTEKEFFQAKLNKLETQIKKKKDLEKQKQKQDIENTVKSGLMGFFK
ncbi:hypothetical protein pb186bvf_006654 [Paramecium bursaria]